MIIYRLAYENTEFKQLFTIDDSQPAVSIGMPSSWTTEDFTSSNDLISRASNLGLQPLYQIKLALGVLNTQAYIPPVVSTTTMQDSDWDCATVDGLNALCQYLIATTEYDGHWYKTDTKVQAYILGAINMIKAGAYPVAGTTWFDFYDNEALLSYSDIQNIFGTISLRIEEVNSRFSADATTLASSGTPTQLLHMSRPGIPVRNVDVFSLGATVPIVNAEQSAITTAFNALSSTNKITAFQSFIDLHKSLEILDSATAVMCYNGQSGMNTSIRDSIGSKIPLDVSIHIGDVWAGHPQTTTITGYGVASAVFDGELTTITLISARPNTTFTPTITVTGSNLSTVSAPVITVVSVSVITVRLTEITGSLQNLTLRVQIPQG